ncbi:NUDIX domain-containing protein [Patescibacteria group bacterium]|nr:NUDIX domain-containing protein [Patescibacteria group bacterium]
MEKKIVYVDVDDNVIGAGSRPDAVEKGIIHRISRVFIFNSKGEMLIQKRSSHVSSFPNRWDDSAAGHVDEGEEYLEAAVRELKEEVGIENVTLKEIGKHYSEITEETPTRKRFNMVYEGRYDGPIQFDPGEVSDVRWISMSDLQDWIKKQPSDFSQGIRHALDFYLKTKAT